MKRTKRLILSAACLAALSGCGKYLDTKPDTKLAVPTTLTDLQALLDNTAVINYNDAGAGEISADNYYLTDADFNALSQDNYKRAYTWQNDYLFSLDGNNDWFNTYRPVFTANTVLETLGSIPLASNQGTYNNVKGQALYIRAHALLQAAVLWAPVFSEETADKLPGIPVRLTTDFNINSVRSTVRESYKQVLADLKAAVPLLPLTPVHVMRPGKPAAYGLLARAYLSMGQYRQAGAYADSCLQISRTLLDYNKLSTTATFPFAQLNAEVIRENRIPVPLPLSNTRARIDPALYASYNTNDLRKTLFFKAGTGGTFVFKGSYEGSGNLFSGIATDEMYLIRAECYARNNQKTEALNDLNTLLATRFKTGTLVPLTAADAAQSLLLILTERRKELLMRGLRWPDLKRLNREGAGIMLSRTTNGQVYTLLPNDPRYALPLPEDIIRITGMPQNLR